MLQWGFLYPVMLGAIPLALAGLVYAYLRRGSAPRRIVSSVLLLKLLPRQPKYRRTFKPPTRFYFELLLLLLLGFGAAGLYFRGTAQRVVVVLDSSLSTAARFGDTTVHAELRERAAQYLSALSSFSEVAVLQPGDSALGAFVSPTEAQALVASSTVRYVEDRLAQLVTQAFSAPAVNVVAVFSDIEAPSTMPANLRWQTLSLASQGLRRDNITISDVSLQPPSPLAKGHTAQLRVRSFAEQAAEVRIVSEVVRSIKEVWRPVPLRNFDIELKQGEERIVPIELPEASAGIAYHFRIEPVLSDGTRGDVLPLDDSAWVTAQSTGTRVAVVSPRSLAELGLEKLTLFDFESTSIEELKKPRGAGGHEFGLAIVDRTPLDFIPTIPTLLSLSSMPELTLGESPQQGSISAWSEGHDVLSYLQFGALGSIQILRITSPLWMEPIVETTTGAVVVAGSKDNSRYVGLGLDIFPFRGSRDPFSSVLLLNSLKWLARTTLTQGYRVLKAPMLLTGPLHRVEVGNGEVQEPVVGEPFALPTRPGPFIVYPEEGDRNATLLAVNFFSPGESDLLTATGIVLPTVEERAEQMPSVSGIAGWLALIVFFALILDVVRYLIPARPRAGSVGA